MRLVEYNSISNYEIKNDHLSYSSRYFRDPVNCKIGYINEIDFLLSF